MHFLFECSCFLGTPPEILMRRTIRHAELDTLLCAHFRFFVGAKRKTERRRIHKLQSWLVEMLRVLPLCSLWSYLCSMMSSDNRVFGKVKAQHPHTDRHTAVRPNRLSSLCLKVLSVFTGTKAGSHSCL